MEKLADLLYWCSLIVERLNGGDLLRGIKRFPTWSAAFPATSPSSGEACAGAFYREGAFKFSHTREQMEDEFPARVAGIEGLSQALKLDPAFLKGAHDFQQVLERTAEPIQPPDHECITRPYILERLLQLRALVFHTLDLFGKDLLISGCFQGVQLQLKMLLLTGDTCRANFHPAFPLP